MNEWVTLFTNSYLIGFSAAATLGPIALLLIQRTLRRGWRVGAVSGVGVALADALYGLAGAVGLSALTRMLTGYQAYLRIAGGSILVFLGVRAVVSKVDIIGSESIRDEKPGGLLGAFISIFLLTLSNPMTILFFSAVYAGLGVGGSGLAPNSTARMAFFPTGVFCGSLTWWLVLSGLIAGLRKRFRVTHLIWLHRASGLVIAGFGIWILVQIGSG